MRQLGPREGALPDKLLGYVEAGITEVRDVAKEAGLTPWEVKQALRHLRKTGQIEIHRVESETISIRGRR